MINATMRNYDFYTFGKLDAYGQETLSSQPQGKIKLAIYILSTAIGTNINYKDATYIALTRNRAIDDSYVIQYGEEKLKVLYTIPFGKYTQVFLAEM
jgi:hypothetical protein